MLKRKVCDLQISNLNLFLWLLRQELVLLESFYHLIVIQHTLAAEICDSNLLGFLECSELLYVICHIHFCSELY